MTQTADQSTPHQLQSHNFNTCRNDFVENDIK